LAAVLGHLIADVHQQLREQSAGFEFSLPCAGRHARWRSQLTLLPAASLPVMATPLS
jgi:hypothetical protein